MEIFQIFYVVEKKSSLRILLSIFITHITMFAPDAGNYYLRLKKYIKKETFVYFALSHKNTHKVLHYLLQNLSRVLD